MYSRSRPTLAATLACLVTLPCLVPFVAAERDDDAVPLAVTQAAAVYAGGHPITSIDEDGDLYEATWDVSGLSHAVTLTATGDLIETEAVVPASDVPAAVRAAAAARLGDEALRFERKQLVVYEVELDGVEDGDEILLLASGRTYDDGQGEHGDHEDADDGDADDDDEVAVGLGSVPRAVLDAALAAVPGARFTSASSETEDGALVYELSGSVDGEEVDVEVSAAGVVLEVEYDEG